MMRHVIRYLLREQPQPEPEPEPPEQRLRRYLRKTGVDRPGWWEPEQQD